MLDTRRPFNVYKTSAITWITFEKNVKELFICATQQTDFPFKFSHFDDMCKQFLKQNQVVF